MTGDVVTDTDSLVVDVSEAGTFGHDLGEGGRTGRIRRRRGLRFLRRRTLRQTENWNPEDDSDDEQQPVNFPHLVFPLT